MVSIGGGGMSVDSRVDVDIPLWQRLGITPPQYPVPGHGGRRLLHVC